MECLCDNHKSFYWMNLEIGQNLSVLHQQQVVPQLQMIVEQQEPEVVLIGKKIINYSQTTEIK